MNDLEAWWWAYWIVPPTTAKERRAWIQCHSGNHDLQDVADRYFEREREARNGAK